MMTINLHSSKKIKPVGSKTLDAGIEMKFKASLPSRAIKQPVKQFTTKPL